MFQHRLACCTTPQLTWMQDWWEYRKRRRLKEEENHSTVSFVHCLSWHSLKPPHPSLSPGTLTPHSPGTLTLQAPSLSRYPHSPGTLTPHSPGTLTLQAPSPLTLQAPSPLTLSRHPHPSLSRYPHSPGILTPLSRHPHPSLSRYPHSPGILTPLSRHPHSSLSPGTLTPPLLHRWRTLSMTACTRKWSIHSLMMLTMNWRTRGYRSTFRPTLALRMTNHAPIPDIFQ